MSNGIRFSFNQLTTFPELGSTSNWVVSFRNREQLNLINGKYVPAVDVNYVEYTTKTENVNVGPLYNLSYLGFIDTLPEKVSMTVYDTDDKLVRKAMKQWVSDYKWQYGLSPSLGQLKSQSAIIDIWHFTKDNNKYYKDSFYILPAGDMDFKGDNSFSADTFPLDFIVVGRE